MLEVAHVGDVADVAHLVAEVLEVAEDDVEGDGRACVAEVGVAVDGGAADIHAHPPLMQGAEELFLTAQSIVNQQLLFHNEVVVEFCNSG